MSDWKVDPNHRRRLLQLQKLGDNKKCVDCHAPNPQWASPKFGIFICLECAGIHRSLGVHISFVRSITMDQFKDEELVRMEKGGNGNFNEYMTSHGVDLSLPHAIKYDNVIAEDYKEKLTCEVEGKNFEEPEHPDFDPSQLGKTKITSDDSSRSETPLENRRSATPSQKDKNEAYFAKLGEQNQFKPDHLPPSQGGKYQGFGSTPVQPSNSNSNNNSNNNGGRNNTLSLENLQADPIGTLTKGWGLFSSALSKSVNDVNESVIKPSYEQWQSGELSEETKRAAAQFGQKFQETSSYGYEALNNFTKNIQEQYYGGEGNSNANGITEQRSRNSGANTPTQRAPEKKNDDEWDDF